MLALNLNIENFNANWSDQFDVGSTNEQKFKLNNEKSIDATMMHKTAGFNYGETDTIQILELPYLGNALSMIILLPKNNNLDEMESLISTENLANWKKDMRVEEVQVSLPKFKFENKYFMKDTLTEIGMPTAFKYHEADFTGMSPTDELYIAEVIHQTFVEVSETGTEAAAATAIIMIVGSIQRELKVFSADHPFMFIIQENDSGNILFLGRLMNPS